MKIVLYRICGNDLPPVHEKGQTYRNLKFILENEPPLEHCIKKWIINRVVDPFEELRLIDLLERHHLDYLRIPFELEAYKESIKRPWQDPIPIVNRAESMGSSFHRLILFLKKLRFLYFRQQRHKKILYTMNNNGARNTALAEGKKTADWILPFDGNCCFDKRGWEGVLNPLLRQTDLDKYFGVPMYRLQANDAFLDFNPDGMVVHEPQIIFGVDSSLRFDPLFRYGSNSKIELLQRIQHKGYGNLWTDNCGYVMRLTCGSGLVEKSGEWRERSVLRENGINNLLNYIDMKRDEGRSCINA